MRVSVLQDNLVRALAQTVRAVDSRSNLPILQNVHLEADADTHRLVITATNLELTIRIAIGAKIDRPGAITLPAKTLTELVSTLAPERVDLTLDANTQTVNIRCGTTNTNVRGLSASEYPRTHHDDVLTAGAQYAVPARTLKRAIQMTEFASAVQDARPILTGLYFALTGDTLSLASADGYRLAVYDAYTEQHLGGANLEMIIPSKSMREVSRTLPDDDTLVCIYVRNGQMVWFEIGDTLISSQLIEGKFLDFRAIIPQTARTRVTANTADLRAACKRAEIFARDSNYSVALSVGDDERMQLRDDETCLRLNGRSAERGDLDSVVRVDVDGSHDYTVAVNIRYLLDVLTVADCETVTLDGVSASTPVCVRTPDAGYVYVVMPMSLSR